MFCGVPKEAPEHLKCRVCREDDAVEPSHGQPIFRTTARMAETAIEVTQSLMRQVQLDSVPVPERFMYAGIRMRKVSAPGQLTGLVDCRIDGADAQVFISSGAIVYVDL